MIQSPKEPKYSFQHLTGRRFKVFYKDYNAFINNEKPNSNNTKRIEGVIENFCPSAEVVLNDEKYGFNVIPYKSIVYMLEIK